jgi:hypothetical protein
VDECWHLHMLYTESYWKGMCKDILELEFHHGPTKGGHKEDAKFEDYYDRTKQAYMTYFGEEPPEDIWPTSKVRFREVNLVRVDLLRHWVIPAGDWRALIKALYNYIKFKIGNLW